LAQAADPAVVGQDQLDDVGGLACRAGNYPDRGGRNLRT
jgi:hypothetical protein